MTKKQKNSFFSCVVWFGIGYMVAFFGYFNDEVKSVVDAIKDKSGDLKADLDTAV